MSFDPNSMEADLRRARPAGLDASLLDRLDACTEGAWTKLTPEETCLEAQLQAIAPAKLPPALMASLESALREVPFPKDETIVRFPLQKPAAIRKHRGWWGAAAAVALTGAVTALLIPTKPKTGNIADTPPANTVITPAPANGGELIPAGINRGLSEASDEGFIWQSNQQPHRVLKFVYKDKGTFKDAYGRTYQVERPRVEYILVPAKTD